MKGKLKKNQRGSVLLAVVCMSMMCMVLATIALSVVNYTTKASSRNVQRTQAKITAEAALSEFIQYYNSNDAYADLKNLASAGDGTEITVDMIGDSNFKDTYGDVKLYVKKNGASGFKVTAECTYSTQTQTVSVVFDSIKQNPNINSYALEASEGADIAGGIATPMDGDICIEKSAGSTKKSMTFSNDAAYHSHVISEYTLYFDSNTSFSDVLNKTGSLNYAPGKGGSEGKFFKQAPTITSTGYMYFKNNITISTEVGKTDVNGKNSDDDGYDSNNLSNMDGYIKADQKIYFGMPSAPKIGTADKPIDVYTHGIYVGYLPQKINGSVNPDYSVIKNAFDTEPDGQVGSNTINGNVYCYIGNNPTYQSGDLFVMNGADTFTVNGDLYVEGNIYIRTGTNGGDQSKLKANSIHCQRNIYFVDGDCNIVATAGIDNGAIKFSQINSGYSESALAGQLMDSPLSVTFDKSGRNKYPQDGYDPATGVDNVSRKSLKSTYGDSSSNTIFAESQDAADEDLKDASKDIAKKYAEALTRTLDTKKFKKKTGTEADLWTKIQGSSNEDTVIEINGSIRLRKQDFGGSNPNEMRRYCVNLTDEDIVIAVPFDQGNISPLIRVNATQAVDPNTHLSNGCFVYIMYYEENDSFNFEDSDQDNNKVKGYYFNGTTANPNELTISNVEVYNKSTGNYESQNVVFTATTESDRTGKKITHSSTNAMALVADLELFFPYDSTEEIDLSKFKNTCSQLLADNAVEINAGESYDTRICFLVPDNFDFELGGNGNQVQGLIYATKSKISVAGSNSRIFGQVKCASFKPPQDNKEGIIKEITTANGSILDYVYAKNSTTNPNADIEIMYYDYRQ